MTALTVIQVLSWYLLPSNDDDDYAHGDALPAASQSSRANALYSQTRQLAYYDGMVFSQEYRM